MNPSTTHGGAGPAATISAADAAAMLWQVAVIGAGPAGAATAIRLARAGLRVLLVDRGGMPRGKICGCCLSPAALAECGRLGFDPVPPFGAVPLATVRLASRGVVARVPLSGGAVLSREVLDTELVRAAIAVGGAWLPHSSVIRVEEPTDEAPLRLTLATTDAETARVELRAERVVVATGLVGHPRIVERGGAHGTGRAAARTGRIGIGSVLAADAAELPGGELLMAVAQQGYCGMVRLEDGRIDLAAAVDRGSLGQGDVPAVLRRLLADALGMDPLGSAAFDAARLRATPPLTHTAPPLAGRTGRLLRVGDAAGYVEPFTGEGIGWALAGARLAAAALLAADGAALRAAPASAAAYAASYRRHFGGRHARCRRVAGGLRLPLVVSGGVRAARLAPWMAARVVPVLTGGGSPHEAAP